MRSAPACQASASAIVRTTVLRAADRRWRGAPRLAPPGRRAIPPARAPSAGAGRSGLDRPPQAAGVPSKTTRPSSSSSTRSAKRSASGRSAVSSTTLISSAVWAITDSMLSRPGGIQAGDRLVEHQMPRLHRQQPGKGHAAALAAAERKGRARGEDLRGRAPRGASPPPSAPGRSPRPAPPASGRSGYPHRR